MKGLVLENKSISLVGNLDLPSPKDGEVLVKVKYASINSYDVETIEGQGAFLKKLGGAISFPVMTGIEFSGVVQSDGSRFKKGDEVFGYPDLMKGQKSHQEYLVISEEHIALKPSNIDFEQSAGLPLGALTTLVALEDVGKIKVGSKVLINGAAGGLGVYAIQIAKIMGAHITAVVGPDQDSFAKNLGADITINYKEQKLQDLNSLYDILLDLTTFVRFSDITILLKSKGIFIPANPFNHLKFLFSNPFRKKKVGYLMVGKGDYKKLTRISKWIEEEKLTAVTDETFALEDYKKGFKRLGEPGKKGRIILRVD